jgi:hypothetical protein
LNCTGVCRCLHNRFGYTVTNSATLYDIYQQERSNNRVIPLYICIYA